MRDQSLKKFLFKIFAGLIRDSSVAIFSLIWFGEEILCGKHFFFLLSHFTVWAVPVYLQCTTFVLLFLCKFN